MSDIEYLQGRILAALERASRGVDKLALAKDDVPDLSQELEAERQANAQLTERVKNLSDRLESETASLQSRLSDAEAALAQVSVTETQMAKLDTELQQVRRANTQLAEACAALRDANAQGVGDPTLINQSVVAELDALRAARSADVAEANAILSVLTPLVSSAKEKI
ncbi:MAG: hypothetical protein E8G75_01375 [Sulfitobacter sp. SK025]|nr:MAG: hypothetical protein E8G75_01375 [Sulfitobacter sp. SK025]